MRITVVSRSWWGSVYGGSERFMYRLAQGLVELGHEVHVITRRIECFGEPSTIGLMHVLKVSKARPLISSFMFSRWATKIVNKIRPDVAVVNSYWGESSPLFIDRKTPVIAVIHDVGLFRSEIAKKNMIHHLLRVFVLKRVVRRVDAIVVPSEGVKKDLIEFLGADPEKIHVLGFEGVEGPFRYEHESNACFDIVQVSRFAPNKGQKVLLQAFRKIAQHIPNTRLWLVGGRGVSPRDLAYLEDVKKEAEEINRELGDDRVRVLVDVPDVGPYYRVADVCVAPSVAEEGYGLSVVECMAYGKPVIASDIFVETGVANEERTYVFPRGDADKLAELLLYVHSHYGEALRKAEKGLEYAKQCSWRRLAEKILNIVNNIVGGSQRGI